MPRARIFGYIACILSLIAGFFFFYYTFVSLPDFNNCNINNINTGTYYAITIPISLIAFLLLGTGMWIGWTILTIKVAPPMPEIVEKKDYARAKASSLCLLTFALGCLFIYGIYIRSYWALAIPAATATLVILGMIFWVGLAIITTRSTLPEDKKQQ